MRSLHLRKGGGFREWNNEQELRRPTLKRLENNRLRKTSFEDDPKCNPETLVRLINIELNPAMTDNSKMPPRRSELLQDISIEVDRRYAPLDLKVLHH